jgi:hypothetical protein
MTRKVLVTMCMILSTFAFASVAVAGAWATTVVDEAPAQFHEGETHEVVYTVLQHGVTPVEEATAIVFRPAKGTESSLTEIVFAGSPTGEPGQYRAHVVVPASGVWLWEVRQGGFGIFELGSTTVADETGWSLGRSSAMVLVAMALGMLLLVMRRIQTRPNSAPASWMTSRT